MSKTTKKKSDGEGYRRPQHAGIRKFPFAVVSFVLALAAFALLGVIGGNLLLAFLNKTASASDIVLLTRGVIAVTVIAGVGFLTALLSLLLRRSKKKLAIAALVIALLAVILGGAILGGYEYIFGKMEQDNALNEADLNVVNPNDDGEIIRQDASERESSAIEEGTEVPEDEEISRSLLYATDIPEEAQEFMNTGKPIRTAKLLSGYEQVTNFLLFGLDKVDSSDSIILVSLDRIHHKIKLISIARDSYVLMPQWGAYAKLTYAHAWGGAELAIRTINLNYSLNITDYVSVNFDQMAEIVDYIGGVDVELTAAEAYVLSRSSSGITTGMCHLDGETALRYSRIRHSSADDSELKRTGRQRKVLISMLDTVKQMPYSALPQLIRDGLGMCQTTFDSTELLEMCLEIVQNNYTIEQHAFPGDEIEYWGGMIDPYFYVVYDLNRASDMIYSIIYEEYYVSAYQESGSAPEGGYTD